MENNGNYLEEIIIPKEIDESNRLGNNIHEFNKFVSKNYLKKCMVFNDEDLISLLPDYSKLFSLIAKITKGEEHLVHLKDYSIFEQLENFLSSSSNKAPLSVRSYAGCGKSEFLTILYQYLYYRYMQGKFPKLPIFISLHYYNKYIYDNSKLFFNQGIRLLKSHINDLFDFLKKQSQLEIILIVDGSDEFKNAKIDLDESIIELTEDLLINTQIIGLRSYVDKRYVRLKKEESSVLVNNTIIDISFEKFDSCADKKQDLVHTFAIIEQLTGKVENAECLSQYILKKIEQFGIAHIDMFHLFLLSKGFQNLLLYQTSKTLSSFYGLYIDQCNLDNKLIAEIAFKMCNHPNKVLKQEMNTREWWKIQKHGSLRDYLSAVYITNKLISYGKDTVSEYLNVFNYVYPREINFFCKEIINESVEFQREAYNSILNLFQNSTIIAQTHFCYLLGRFEDKEIQNYAYWFLKQLEQSVYAELNKRIPTDYANDLTTSDKQYLLYYRSICISLIRLNDNDVSEIYIYQLIRNKYFDNLNRGFYLECYENIIFSPSQPETLKNEDNLCDCSKTYQRLYSKIFKALNNNKTYPLFQIELYTLCSLLQHRQSHGIIDTEKINLLIEIIEKVENSNFEIFNELRVYLSFIKEQFQLMHNFKITHFIEELCQLKLIPRKDWVIRDVTPQESIASHMYGSMLLAYLYLPSSLSGESEYDKDKILRMLLIHDIGKAYIGDWTPNEKDKKIRKEECNQLQYLNLMGTYEDIPSKINLFKLFDDFICGENINARIARDMDKLDNLLQLIIYNNHNVINDFEDFKFDLVNGHIYTPIGSKIRDEILKLDKRHVEINNEHACL